MSLQEKSLFMVLELSNKKWKVGFGDGSRDRYRNVQARDLAGLVREVEVAKKKLGLRADAHVVSGFEAGRDGMWIDRFLKKQGYENVVMDPASIEVSRHARNRKTDRLDAEKLLRALLRGKLWGDKKAFSAVCVPSEEQEAQMRVERERERLVKEHGAHRARIKSLCILHGVDVKHPAKVVVGELRDWEGKPFAQSLVKELCHEQDRLRLVDEQLKHLEEEQAVAVKEARTVGAAKAAKLCRLKAVGLQSGWLLSHECFAWRTFRNRKKLGAFAGLTGTPYDSGDTLREQGISKAGSRRVRTTMIELAWGWLRWQRGSTLAKWFRDRYEGVGSSRSKRKGIVALARKLLIALWKYLEQGTVPEGAIVRA